LKPEKVFRRYDIRGRFGEEIDGEFAEILGKAFGSFARDEFGRRVVVSKDNKESSEALRDPLVEGLRSTGVKVIDVGTGPTDYTAFCGNEHGAVSVQITSSHMPLDFNGFKLMYPEGNGFVNDDLDRIEELFRERGFQSGEGSLNEMEDTMKQRYRDRIRIHGSRLGTQSVDKTVVVDTLGGATTGLLPDLLRDIGAEVIDITEDDVPYRDPPNPKPEQLKALKKKVDQGEADLGLATDMDGDRIAAYTNRFLTGDEIFGVMAQAVNDDLVASIDTSQALEDLMSKRGKEVFYTRVGDPFVMDKALEEDLGLAGEPNGHYAFLDFVPYNSGILAGLVLAGTDIEESIQRMPKYHVKRFSFEVEDKREAIEEIKASVGERYEVVSEVDGVKFDTGKCDVLARPSGSSDKIRVVAESERRSWLKEELPEIREVVQ
jgi:phosphomannomutase